ncbi:hypothetical protein LMG7141_01190 [Ralstonia condita]|uniref:Type I restriction modification DNA specificity domain-containing protein n=1 Tax=Ralstonia condita TaxID=3058600 RepID=A0ABM9J434_9RALS|nr:restriction endonuclease subunit S [Ralstonia sp. LMG 7141]CAJ0781762.1 hypothetical protein LMG7141_01190 [Ralstonia sp. LMG 7141]
MSFDLPNLPDGWEYRPLNECALDGSITYGVVQPGTAQPEGIPLVRVNNFREGQLDLTDLMKISSDVESKYSRTRLKGGEVLLTLVGSVGQVAMVPESLAGFNVARAVGVIHPISEIGPEWISACLRSPASQSLLISRANTTVQTTINLKDVRALPIPIPPKGERDEIARVISTLDDRIALLRETNATLEAIAQALFKSWFVDFDPVRAKAEGREPEGMDSDTAALFPDSFEASELGLVPRGWRVRSVAEVSSNVFSGGTPDTRKAEYWVGPLRWFSSGETRHRVIVDCEKRINALAVENSSTRLAIPGDILIASAGQGHTRGQTSYSAVETYINQSVVAIRAEPSACHSLWLFHNLSRRYDEMRNISDSHSSRGSLTTKLLGGMRLVVPESLATKSFVDAVGPLMESQINNCRTLSILTPLRDTLLPRLISGQLRISEAADALETV